MAASDQPLDEIVSDSKPTSKEDWFDYIQKAMEDGKSLRRQHKIQRVAKMLRDKNQDCFEPIAVSIGPYHRNKPHLERMEKLKAPILGQYVEALDCTAKELLYHEVEKVAVEARECYAEDATKGMSDEDFTRMMFLDGCFFLQFIKGRGRRIQMTRSDFVCVKRDLFLMENQLPFIVLKALSGLSDSKLVEMMVNFIGNWPHPRLIEEQSSGMMDFNCHLRCYPKRQKELSNAERENEQSKTEGEPEPIHLLQLLRQSLLNPEDLQGKHSRDGDEGDRGKGEVDGSGDAFSAAFASLAAALASLTAALVASAAALAASAAAAHTYRSATELKKVGIHFRKSQSHRFTDVGFRNNLGLLRIHGELRLPPMYVDDGTKSRLLNLVAYEMCADVLGDDADVTSYVSFLDKMIDSAEDVKELRSQGILINYLGSDQQVADLFNEISDNLVANPKVYASVNQQIEKHYKNKFKKWFLVRLYTHFKAPWSCLSLIAALILLLLTLIQAVYTVMAFYAPKNG